MTTMGHPSLADLSISREACTHACLLHCIARLTAPPDASYTNVTMYIQLNTPSLNDGVLKVWAGPSASPIVDMSNLIFKEDNAPLR